MQFLESNQLFLWIGFNLFVLAMLALDLGVFHRRDHTVSVRESLTWTVAWIALAIGFNVALYYWKSGIYGPERGTEIALQFLTGYLIEKSLSIDNIFVFLLLFAYFRVPSEYQHRVLFWGIIGALIFRGIFIALGAVLIAKFHWVIYLFGAFLIFTGIKMAWVKDKQIHPERNPVLRLFRKLMPVTDQYHGGKFFIRDAGKLIATPLFLVLLLIETSDIIFAVDSVPAIFAVSQDPFIVYTANVFAILGLRSLYFALAAVMRLFHHLHYGLSAILIFVGIKMALTDIFKIPVVYSLGAIGVILALSIAASLLWPKKDEDHSEAG
ncbi:MAG: TerC family protein [bacterium]|nr:TerC family protein [bacterium]